MRTEARGDALDDQAHRLGEPTARRTRGLDRRRWRHQVTGPASSPSRGGPSAASVKSARAFQIIQPFASLSAAACISAATWSAL